MHASRCLPSDAVDHPMVGSWVRRSTPPPQPPLKRLIAIMGGTLVGLSTFFALVLATVRGPHFSNVELIIFSLALGAMTTIGTFGLACWLRR